MQPVNVVVVGVNISQEEAKRTVARSVAPSGTGKGDGRRGARGRREQIQQIRKAGRQPAEERRTEISHTIYSVSSSI